MTARPRARAGECNFFAALKTAKLALKHRAEKRLQQRIVMFVGSPVTGTVKELEKTGKQVSTAPPSLFDPPPAHRFRTGSATDR